VIVGEKMHGGAGEPRASANRNEYARPSDAVSKELKGRS
jgi:hypothetical protein